MGAMAGAIGDRGSKRRMGDDRVATSRPTAATRTTGDVGGAAVWTNLCANGDENAAASNTSTDYAPRSKVGDGKPA